MRSADRRKMLVNRAKWDEAVPHHVRAPSYDVDGFLAGRSSLEPIEIEELGPVEGLDLLHLQCHFGLDTLSWARRGARVTGVDYSGPAVAAARRLARRAGLAARFVRSDLYALPGPVGGSFDVVYTAKGAICWLPELDPWARIVAGFLRPGGRFYLLEDHPFAEVFPNDEGVEALRLGIPYLGRRPNRDVTDGTYATDTKMRHRVSYSWVHPVGDVLNALVGAGLRLTAVREFPYSYWRKFPFLVRRRDGYWHLPKDEGIVPLMWSVRASKPAD